MPILNWAAWNVSERQYEEEKEEDDDEVISLTLIGMKTKCVEIVQFGDDRGSWLNVISTL